MIRKGNIKNFIYMPGLGLIEAGETPEDAIHRINKAEVDKEIADKKEKRRIEKEFPNCIVTKCGDSWLIEPK